MTNTKWTLDPLGRSAAPWRARLVALWTALAITGSAWPIYAGSGRAIVDSGLNKSPHPGSLLAVEMSGGQPDWRILGEWPPAPTTSAKAAKPPKHEPLEPDDDLDARIDELDQRVLPLAHQLKAQQDQGRALGLFPNDRQLCMCPHCGLAEDVLADGRLITSYEIGEADTGLRFIEPESDDGPFPCPGCGGEVRSDDA